MMLTSTLPEAVACIRGGDKAPQLCGTVRFYRCRDGVLVEADIHGLPKTNTTGFFAMHIHQGGSCSGQDFADTGTHYNPTSAAHPNHAGDLPQLLSASGRAHMAVLTDRFSIPEILGKTLVIHQNPDDFHTQPAGNAGTKIACGVIRTADQTA